MTIERLKLSEDVIGLERKLLADLEHRVEVRAELW